MKAIKYLMVVAVIVLTAPGLFALGETEGAAYPGKSISYVIPFNPGGQSDIAAQVQKAELQEALGVNILVKHKPGAGGAVAWAEIAKGDADGYTVVGNNIPHIIIWFAFFSQRGFNH